MDSHDEMIPALSALTGVLAACPAEERQQNCSWLMAHMAHEYEQKQLSEAKITVMCNDLIADGWREYPNQFKKYARCFYRQFDAPSVCSGNPDKPGMKIEISVGDGYAGIVSMEMELCAGLKDGTWLKIQNYGLPKTVAEVRELIPRMLLMWESANE